MSDANATSDNPQRRHGLGLIAAAVVLGGIGWGGWHWFEGRHSQSTDNAYVAGNLVQITAQVNGTDHWAIVTAMTIAARLNLEEAVRSQNGF